MSLLVLDTESIWKLFEVESESLKGENTASYQAILDRYKSDITKRVKKTVENIIGKCI